MPTIPVPARTVAAFLVLLVLAATGCGRGSGTDEQASSAETTTGSATTADVCSLATPAELADATRFALGEGRPEPTAPAGTSACSWDSADTTTTAETLNVSWASEDPGLITAENLESGGAEQVAGLGHEAFLGDGQALWVFADGGLLIVDLSVSGDRDERVLDAQTAAAGLILERLSP